MQAGSYVRPFSLESRAKLKFGLRMFVSRTVAAEICMEAKLNDTAYGALKILDKSGELRFELQYVSPLLKKTAKFTLSPLQWPCRRSDQGKLCCIGPNFSADTLFLSYQRLSFERGQ